MKAILCTQYGPPEVLQLKEVPKPIPRRNELGIKIFATTITASDCIVRGFKVQGVFRPLMRLAIGFTRPRNPILGMVLAGEVETVGQDVTRFQVGDPVYTFNIRRFGAYAEYICLPENEVIAPMPSNLTYEEAAAIPYGGMLALHFLRKGNLRDGQQVLVYGASGAVGTAAVQLARAFGARVTGVCSTSNLELVRSLGAETVIDYTQEDFTTRGERYDLVFNAVGKRKAQLQCQNALAPEGQHITVDDGSPKLRVEDLNFLTERVQAGELKPVIDRVYPLEEMVAAHRYVDGGHKKGNLIITVRSTAG
jgi:NADPH:quinone reductase-like Zn-dependent oxidoreductase